MCRLEGRSPGLGGVGTGSVRAVLMPAAVASSRMLRIRCRAWLACSAIVTYLVATWREGAKLPSNCCAGLTVGGAGRSLIGRRLAIAAAVVFELILKIIIILLIIFLGFIKSKPC